MTAAKVSRLPATAAKPKKKAATAAREAEAEDGYVIVEHLGITLRVPVSGKIPVAAIDAFRDGDNYEGTRRLLGAQQWKSLSDAGMTRDDLNELGIKLKDATGN